MSANMDPNDHDTVHYEYRVWGFSVTACHEYTEGRETTDDWEYVTCRLCILSEELRGAG